MSEEKIRVTYETCPECNGAGKVWYAKGESQARVYCDLCRGSGQIIRPPHFVYQDPRPVDDFCRLIETAKKIIGDDPKLTFPIYHELSKLIDHLKSKMKKDSQQ